MSPKPFSFAAGAPPDGASKPASGGTEVRSPDPPPCTDLSDREVALYHHLCQMLREAGIEHMTAGLPIVVIVKTYDAWLDALQLCDDRGRYRTSQNGYSSLQPWAEDEKRLKMELGQWLPKACLTIPSLARVRKDVGGPSPQDDLFSELVGHATTSPRSNSPH
ncbi:hypothetical protein [uncultured Azohydromonas sp.]|uniref:hypothetical protein n=1 Tax=uncultured Azohydromonas sp. TaxID=487342 RepID=UPI00263441B5|nr:hypothetical protein [uncultured Azohydromonas sp.]